MVISGCIFGIACREKQQWGRTAPQWWWAPCRQGTYARSFAGRSNPPSRRSSATYTPHGPREYMDRRLPISRWACLFHSVGRWNKRADRWWQWASRRCWSWTEKSGMTLNCCYSCCLELATPWLLTVRLVKRIMAKEMLSARGADG